MANSNHADLVLLNARVLTPSRSRGPGPTYAQAVAVAGESITAVGSNPRISGLAGPGARSIDCAGMTLVPGFVDSHCHLLALAASLQGLECSPRSVPTIRRLQQMIRKASEDKPPGQWVRGFGYDDESFAESRHPTRWDLDQAAPQHPVRLDHRSGHASVLNSLGLKLAGIHRDTPDPVYGVIHREPSTGEPTGLLFEMAGVLRQRLASTRSPAEFHQGVEGLNQRLLACGITSVQDAGPANGLERWDTFKQLQEQGRLGVRITMMAGASQLDEFQRVGLTGGSGDRRLRLGHAKIMLTFTTGTMAPDVDGLREMVRQAHRSGFPVAIHAVEQEAIEAAARVIESEMETRPPGVPPDRIEHCAECPPELADLVRRSGASVVTQPGLIYWHGDEYNARVDPWLLPNLYPVGALARGGIPVAFGSDAPVTDPNPWPGIYSAVTRTGRSGATVPPPQSDLLHDSRQVSQVVSIQDALQMYTEAGTRSEGTNLQKGTIETGKVADLVLLDKNPFEADSMELADIRPVMTIIGGRVVWER